MEFEITGCPSRKQARGERGGTAIVAAPHHGVAIRKTGSLPAFRTRHGSARYVMTPGIPGPGDLWISRFGTGPSGLPLGFATGRDKLPTDSTDGTGRDLSALVIGNFAGLLTAERKWRRHGAYAKLPIATPESSR